MFFFFCLAEKKSKMVGWGHKIPLNMLSSHTNTPNWMCMKVTAGSLGEISSVC